ncbi:nitroreductase/quinone reductase family protein [Streptomyces sp. NPDC101234]|uniref:nitroreductase/quinone reductase family protein n=1 Tax=Streptomyces sp. NPDC101234 TaxID=3366138 RepID=UPI003828CD97
MITPEILDALSLHRDSSASERTIDITTYGARTGQPRRIEIWFHHVDGKWYLASTPDPRSWYANLRANPRFIFHLKNGVHADLQATAVPITDPAPRRRILTAIVSNLNHLRGPDAALSAEVREEWVKGSPLVEIVFDEIGD